MAKFGKFSPSRSHPDLNMAMMSSPILPQRQRDPRVCDPWNLQERQTSSLPPFPEEYARQSSVQPAPYPQFVGTPDTGEAITPIAKSVPLRPAKLFFSPHPNKAKAMPNNQQTDLRSHCLMFPTHLALQSNPIQIEDMQTLFASPILQENLHYLLMDHSLDEAKISETLKYLGIPKCLFVQYINRVYPQHFYTILNNLNGSTQ